MEVPSVAIGASQAKRNALIEAGARFSPSRGGVGTTPQAPPPGARIPINYSDNRTR